MRGPRLRRRQRLVDRQRVQVGVERGGQDECVLVDLAVLRVEGERGFVPQQRAAEVEAVDLRAVWRPRGLREQRIARIQTVVVVLREGLAVEGRRCRAW